MPFYKSAKPISPWDIMSLTMPLQVYVPKAPVAASQTMDYLKKLAAEYPDTLKMSPLLNTPELRQKALLNIIKERALAPKGVPLPLYQEGGLVMNRDDENIPEVDETRLSPKKLAMVKLARGEPFNKAVDSTRLSANQIADLAIKYGGSKKEEPKPNPVVNLTLPQPTGTMQTPQALVGEDTDRWFVPPKSGYQPMDLSLQGQEEVEFQQGGTVPGGGKGDVIPIAAEPDEYVIPREVVLKKGTDFFDNIVRKAQEELGQKLSKPSKGTLPQQFENGGTVRDLVPGEETAGIESYNPNRFTYQNTEKPKSTPTLPEIPENPTGNPSTIRLKQEMGLSGYGWGGVVKPKVPQILLPEPYKGIVDSYMPEAINKMRQKFTVGLPGYQPGGLVSEEEAERRRKLEAIRQNAKNITRPMPEPTVPVTYLTGGVPAIESATVPRFAGSPHKMDVGRTAGETAGLVQTGRGAYAFYPEGNVSPNLTPQETEAVRATLPVATGKETMPEILMGGYRIPRGITPEESYKQQALANMAFNLETPVRVATGKGTEQIVTLPDVRGRAEMLYPEQFMKPTAPQRPYTIETAEGIKQWNPETGQWTSTGFYPYTKPTAEGGGGTGGGMAKVGNLAEVKRMVVSKYLPIVLGRTPETKKPAFMDSLVSTDLTGNINDARLRNALTPAEREHYDYIMKRSQELVSQAPPATAVDRAIGEWRTSMEPAWYKRYPATQKREGVSLAEPRPTTPPQGAKPTGRTVGGKPAYKLPNGDIWVPD